jgi:hypothetical protein
MSGLPVQLQFDLVGAVNTTAAVAAAAVGFSKILRYCYREDIGPLAIPALERLGGWLMVDPGRLRHGEQALSRVPPPRIISLNSLSIIIGLDTDRKGSFLQVVRSNNCSTRLSFFSRHARLASTRKTQAD